jgi:hypothetical protein
MLASSESPARLDFPVVFMCVSDGWILIDILHMILCRDRVYARIPNPSLEKNIKESRAYEENLTETLAGQVEDTLRILIAAFDRIKGLIVRTVKRVLRMPHIEKQPVVCQKYIFDNSDSNFRKWRKMAVL